MPASRIASSLAAMAKWQNGSIRRASLRPTTASASKPLSSAANVVAKADGSKCVIGAAPLRPAIMASQNSGTVAPMGVSAPSPVTTTRRSVNGMEMQVEG